MLSEHPSEPPLTSYRPVRDLLAYGMAVLGSKAVLLVGTPILTRELGQSEYGRVALAITLMALVAAVVGVGSDAVFTRFFFLDFSPEGRRDLTRTWLTFLALSTSVPILAIAPVANPLATFLFGPGHTKLLFLVAGGVPPIVLGTVLNQLFRNTDRANVFAVLVLGTAVVQLGLGLLAATNGLGSEGVVGAIVLAETLAVGPKLWVGRSHVVGGVLDRPLLRKLIGFGLPLIPASLSAWAFTSIDRAMLSTIVSPAEVGVYTVAVFVSQPVLLGIHAFAQAWEPSALRLFAQNPAASETMLTSTTTLLTVCCGTVGIGLIVSADFIVSVLAPGDFSEATTAVPPLVIGAVLLASTRATSAPLTFHLRTREIASTMFAAALVNIAANAVLIPPFGLHGAAWATALSYAILAVTYPVISRRLGIAVLGRELLTVIPLLAGGTLLAVWIGVAASGMTLLVAAGATNAGCLGGFLWATGRFGPAAFGRPPR